MGSDAGPTRKLQLTAPKEIRNALALAIPLDEATRVCDPGWGNDWPFGPDDGPFGPENREPHQPPFDLPDGQ